MRCLLIFLSLLLCMATTTHASTWIDPVWDSAIHRANLVAMAHVVQGEKGRITLSIDKVFEGSNAARSLIVVDGMDDDEHGSQSWAKPGRKLLAVLQFDKRTKAWQTFTPSFGLFPANDSLIALPLKDPVMRYAVRLSLADSLLEYAFHPREALAAGLRTAAMAVLARSDMYSKQEPTINSIGVALEVLVRTGNETIIEQARRYLDCPYPAVQASAVRALGQTGSAEAVAPLLQRLPDPSSNEVLSLMGRALWQCGGSNDPVLRTAIGDASGEPAPLSHDIMFPIFNDLTPPRWSLSAAAMRAGGDKRPYDTLLLKGQDWLAGQKDIHVNMLEHAKTWYGLDEAMMAPVDSVLILNFNTDTFSHFPSAIFRFRNLRVLSLGGCPISNLPDSLSLLDKLEELQLSGETLHAFPPVICRMTSLRRLYIANTKITRIPDCIGNLRELRVLGLSGNKLHTLPSSIGRLQQLKDLGLRMAGIDSLPASVAQLPALKHIELYGNSLDHIPAPLLQNASVAELEIGSNKIGAIPADLSAMKGLRYIDLSYNELTKGERARIDSGYHGIIINTEGHNDRAYSLEDALEDTASASSVSVHGKDWGRNAPYDFSKLRYTRYLGLVNNRLAEVPASICNMPALHSLRLDNNAITSLPACLATMRGLTNLYLAGNKITTLPEEIAAMYQLAELFLNDNQLSAIPDWVAKLPNLRYLGLTGNPLTQATKERIRKLFAGSKTTVYLD